MGSNDKRQNVLDRVIGYFAPARALRRNAARELLALGQFRASDMTTLRADWIKMGQGGSQTPNAFELATLRERSRDARRNDPIAAGGIDTYADNIVGEGLQPQSRMRSDVLNLAPDRVKVLQRQAESAWEIFSKMAGADNRLTFSEIQFISLCKIIEDGEIIVIPTWAKEPWRPFGRCIELLESERLSGPEGYAAAVNKKVENGIRFGQRGEPVSYFIRESNGTKSKEIAAFDNKGRPKVLHVFPTRRPGQQRGIPVLAPVLTMLHDKARYMEATLVNARVAALLAVFITSQNQFGQFGTEVTNASGTFGELYPGMVGRLKPGESISVVSPNQPGDNYAGYMESLLRMVGVALGLPYELLVKDFSKTNYSSARAALLEGRRMFKRWRSWFSAKFCQPIWELVLEEAFLRGMFEAPDFYRYKHEYCRALWVGGAWGWVDPVKEVEAARKAIDYGLSNYAEECAAQGRDWEENVEQLAREQDYIDKRGVRIDRSRPDKGEKQDEQPEEK